MRELKKLQATGPYEVSYHQNEVEEYSRIILLLHGYSETGEKIFKKMSKELPSDALILAPNGIFPLPKSFPLGKRAPTEELLMGYAWYFYDAENDHYLVEYSQPAMVLSHFLDTINKDKKPIQVIGYSQGGYLAPFLSFYNEQIDQIIGINCSFRHQHFPRPIAAQIDAINGNCDVIVDPKLAQKRHQEIIQAGSKGSFILLEDQTHRLSPAITSATLKLLK